MPDDAAKDLANNIAFAADLDHGFYYFGYTCIGLLVFYVSYTMFWFGKNGTKKLFPGLCCAVKAQIDGSTLAV